MVAKLITTSSTGEKTEYELTNETTTIGRKPSNDIPIDNLSVSGRHAQVITILEDSFLEDLGSTNGTYVNGKLVKKHALEHGDSITLGKFDITYQNSSGGAEQDFEQTMIYLQITRGVASRNHLYQADMTPTVSVLWAPVTPAVSAAQTAGS